MEKMIRLLGEEAGSFFESYERDRSFGLRINPLKAGERLPESLEGLERIPWSQEGLYYPEELRPGKSPLHEAGLYYIQEPSAQACAEGLAPKTGERILDLCAAPGGKSTHLAGKMGQKGLLVCNEIHPARAKILSQNIERMGIGNAVVTNMEPAGLVPLFREFFDGIAVDAPCSGEGMFRKDENARLEWSPGCCGPAAGSFIPPVPFLRRKTSRRRPDFWSGIRNSAWNGRAAPASFPREGRNGQGGKL